MSSNHYTPEMTPKAMPQEQIMPPKPMADTQVMANASQTPAPRQEDGITTEKYQKSIKETASLSNQHTAGAISAGVLAIGLAYYLAGAAFKPLRREAGRWDNVLGRTGEGALFGIGGVLANTIYRKIKHAPDVNVINELANDIAQHEAGQGAAPQALQMQPTPEQMAAMQNYQPTPEEMVQLEAMQQQAMQEMNMLAQMKLDDSAHPAVKQMQGLAQTMVAGQELSPEQQQQAAALMDQIANSPELQHEIEASLKKRPEYDGPTPDTVEKVAPKAALPSPHSVTPESAERVQEPASREVS